MSTEESQEISKAISAVSSLLAFLVFTIVYVLVGLLAGMWDSIRGLSDDPLQILFREFIAPGVGGYAGIVAAAALPRVNARWAFYAFGVLVGALAIGLFIWSYFFPAEAGAGLYDAAFGSLTLLAAIVGAVIGLRQRDA